MDEWEADRGYAILGVEGMAALMQALIDRGHRLLGPRIHEGAIVYDDIASPDDLPAGWTDEQAPGRYALKRRDDAALFGYVVGPQSWKRFLHPPTESLFRVEKTAEGLTFTAAEVRNERFAFFGVRGCEIAAIAVQDRVFLAGPFADAGYGIRREDAFIVAVNCGTAGGTCFCTSMGTGPKVRSGFDLALTELIGAGRHVFLVETGSAAGAEVLAGLPQQPAAAADISEAEAVVARTAGNMGRHLDTRGLKELLQANPDHPRWDVVAEACLSCGNCTMVCPTCFCTTVEESSDLSGQTAERTKHWDSCFTLDFSYLHGGSVRQSGKARYRQWMTHKLASWIDQFGTSGCVGCGRCLTWCPVGIDITEEAAAIRARAKEATHGGS